MGGSVPLGAPRPEILSPMRSACCLLPAACCLLPAACCLLPASSIHANLLPAGEEMRPVKLRTVVRGYQETKTGDRGAACLAPCRLMPPPQ